MDLSPPGRYFRALILVESEFARPPGMAQAEGFGAILFEKPASGRKGRETG
jgi:hypothetical protein